jgi:hypothetical protein
MSNSDAGWTKDVRLAIVYMKTLRNNWEWKEDASPRHKQELAELNACIDKCLTLVYRVENDAEDNQLGHA